MAVITIQEGKIPLKAYLRADSHSQCFKLESNDGTEPKDFVTEEMFWGKSTDTDALYLDYSSISGRTIEITKGITSKAATQILRDTQCDDWLNDNIIRLVGSKLIVIQGYAGCGKSTLVHDMVRKSHDRLEAFYIDIGQKWDYAQEPNMFFDEVLNTFDNYLNDIIQMKKWRNKIWAAFLRIGLSSEPEISELDSRIKNSFTKFKLMRGIPRWDRRKQNIREHLYEMYHQNDSDTGNGNSSNLWHSRGQITPIVLLLLLLVCAKESVLSENKQVALFFDNLDIITDPNIPAEIIVSLWNVINRFVKFKAKYERKTQNKLPDFGLFISVRKVMYSHITSNLPDLEMHIVNDSSLVCVCDVSNLYLSRDIVKNRIQYWMKRVNDSETKTKLEQMQKLMVIYDDDNPIDYEKRRMDEEYNAMEDFVLPGRINLDAIFNHNYRAFCNAFSIFLDNNEYRTMFLNDTESEDWQKVATFTFAISLLYTKEKIWNQMGFGCKDFNKIDYPTTLNRLILNYLFAARCGQALRRIETKRKDMLVSDSVSLKNLIEKLNRVKFITVNSGNNEEQIQAEYDLSAEGETEETIIERLADMCARSSRKYSSDAYGYDSEDDELWRRPLYFVGGIKVNHTGASEIELASYFKECIEHNKSDKISFSITDEGTILVQDIFASFEFYSARYCKYTLSKPLHQVDAKEELEGLIWPVYEAILLCCKRHEVFMAQYMKKYNIDKMKYLKLEFHPRTKPKFNKNRNLRNSSFRPQLHIIRVIFQHIAYFNSVKRLFSSSEIKGKNEMCICLTQWIKKYLELYRHYFYDVLDLNIYKADNSVYDGLKKQVDKQLQNYESGNYENIDIIFSGEKYVYENT